MRMNLTETWLTQISKSTGMTPEDVQKNVMQWLNHGRSLDYIKRVLILTALVRGKKLHFVSKRGTN